jgi:hypothetical protein
MAGQIWAVASTGGYLYSDNLSEVLRYQVQPTVKFRQFAGVKDAALQAKKHGINSTGTFSAMSQPLVRP